MIRDLYDNSIVAYKTGAQQTVNLVLDTIRLAMKQEKKNVAAELQLHSDQGFQYTSHAYFQLTKKYDIRRQNPVTSSRKKYQKKEPLSGKEKRRFIQLAASICLFVAVFLGRGIFPEQLSQWKMLLAQDINFKAAFSAFGQAVSDGAPVLDTLENLWVEVFAGGAVVEGNKTTDSIWQEAPIFS